MKMRKTIRDKGRGLLDLTRPAVMGIINATPDSFYSGSRIPDTEAAARCGEMLRAGAANHRRGRLLHTSRSAGAVGRRGTRASCAGTVAHPRTIPGRDSVGRHIPSLCGARMRGPLERGHHQRHISGGDPDPDMWDAVAELGVPYVLMHTRGTPDTMQSLPQSMTMSPPKCSETWRRRSMRSMPGVADVIVDPGFGFRQERRPELLSACVARRFQLAWLPAAGRHVAQDHGLEGTGDHSRTVAARNGGAQYHRPSQRSRHPSASMMWRRRCRPSAWRKHISGMCRSATPSSPSATIGTAPTCRWCEPADTGLSHRELPHIYDHP